MQAEIAAGELPASDAGVLGDALDEALSPRSNDNGNQIDMGAVQFVATGPSAPGVSFLPSGATTLTVPYGTSSVGVAAQVTTNTGTGTLPVTVGNVTFTVTQGATTIGIFSAPVNNSGIASTVISIPPDLPVGAYAITTTYFAPGDPSLPVAIPLAITPAPTSIIVGNDSVPAGSSGVTFAVGVSSPGGTVSGTGAVAVTVLANGLPPIALGSFSVVNGVATITSTLVPDGLPVGAYQMLESFSGATNFTSGNAIGTLTVTTDPTTVVGGSAGLNFYGASSPTFTITAAVNSPDGTVNGGSVSISLVANNTTTPIGAGAVTNGSATITVPAGTLPPSLQTGTYQLIESYSGSSPFASSSGSGTLAITLASSSVVAGNASVNYYGSTPSSAFQLTVGVNSPAGTVSSGSVSVSLVEDNTTTSLGTATLKANGTATLSVASNALPANLAPGTYQLIETYTDVAGGQFASSSGTGSLTVNSASTTVVPGSVTVNYFTTTSPQFTVTVGVNSPNSTVNDGSVSISLVANGSTTPLGSATVSNGTATVTVPTGTLPANLRPGSYQLIETYSGSAPFASSTGTGSLTELPQFNPINVPITHVVAGNGSVDTHGGTITIPVVVNSPAATVNSGTVTISLVNGSSTTVVGAAAVTGGSANVSVSIPAGLAPGNYSGPRKLDHQLSYSGGPGKGERWQVSGSSTRRRGRVGWSQLGWR